MPRFSVDLDDVEKSISKRAYKLSDVQHRIKKIAFDVVKFSDGNADELWQIQDGEDGNKYIVALYNDDEEKVATASAPTWSVVIKNSDLHVFYKQEHLCKVASADLGIPSNELDSVKSYLPNKLASNKNLVAGLFSHIDYFTAKSFVIKHPELSVFAQDKGNKTVDLIKSATRNAQAAVDTWINYLNSISAEPAGGFYKYQEPRRTSNNVEKVSNWDKENVSLWVDYLKKWVPAIAGSIMADSESFKWYDRSTTNWSNKQAQAAAVQSAQFINQAKSNLASIDQLASAEVTSDSKQAKMLNQKSKVGF